MDRSMTSEELARALGVDQRTLRRFLRDDHTWAREGGRWSIPRRELPKVRRHFAKWHEAHRRRFVHPAA